MWYNYRQSGTQSLSSGMTLTFEICNQNQYHTKVPENHHVLILLIDQSFMTYCEGNTQLHTNGLCHYVCSTIIDRTDTDINIPRKYPQVAPAGPAPTIATSKSFDAFCTKHKYSSSMDYNNNISSNQQT